MSKVKNLGYDRGLLLKHPRQESGVFYMTAFSGHHFHVVHRKSLEIPIQQAFQGKHRKTSSS